MLLSLNWLKDYVKIPNSITPEELGKTLTLRTVEVENISLQGKGLDNVVVGKILELKKHPNAERLQLVKIDIGKKILDIVCGAQNIQVGDFVPVALIGAKLPNGLEIKEAEIRGEKSFGMLCAPDELGLGTDHSGILILSKEKLGVPVTKILKMDDVIYEVDNKSLTNRPDLWGHLGMARDISAFLNVSFKEYKYNNKILKTKTSSKIGVKVEDKKACPRYMAIGLENITLKDSPEWIKRRLESVGLRAINNIVDATNYVMLDLGQPMHAFDKNLVDKIVVRWAKSGEIMKTLDGQERKLDESMLVVADSNKPVAIAGIMGGAESEITENTNSIILEAATWEPTQIRKTSQKLSLRTESSMRFEKSLDPDLCPPAIVRAVEIIKETCPQLKVSSELADISGLAPKKISLVLDLDWLSKKIGDIIPREKSITILKKLGFNPKVSKNEIKVIVPSWRATKDISIPEDLVEEIARIYGYDNLKPSMPRIIMEASKANQNIFLERKIKELISFGAGFSEVYNYSFLSEEQLDKLQIKERYLRLANPISANESILRPSLIPNLLENVKTNQANYNEFGLFEIGDVYLDKPGEITKGGDDQGFLPLEKRNIGLLAAGVGGDKVFYRLKGALEYLFGEFKIESDFVPANDKSPWARAEAEIKIFGKTVGRLSLCDVSVARAMGIKKDTAVAEIDFKAFSESVGQKGDKKYQSLPKYPPVIRDLAFVVNADLLYNDIKKNIKSSSRLIKQVDLFDIYQGEKIGAGKKNIAFHIIYMDENKTLSAEEVEAEQKKVISNLEKKFNAQIRNF